MYKENVNARTDARRTTGHDISLRPVELKISQNDAHFDK